VGVGVADGTGVAAGVGVTTGAGFLTATPLFHTKFFPDLIHVYLMPAEVLVCPCFVHLVPGFTAALTGVARNMTIDRAIVRAPSLRMDKW
jgi:hypothetical protein